MSEDKHVTLTATKKLTGPENWSAWYKEYRAAAEAFSLWSFVNPDDDPRIDVYHERFTTYAAFKAKWERIKVHDDGLDEVADTFTEENWEEYVGTRRAKTQKAMVKRVY